MAKDGVDPPGVSKEDVLRALREPHEKREDPCSSPAAWKRSWRDVDGYHNFSFGSSAIAKYTDNSDSVKRYEGWRWIEGKEIRLFTDGSVREEAVKPVVAGINELIDDLDLDLKVNYYRKFSDHPSVTEPIRLSMENGKLDGEKLGRYFMAETWRQPPNGKQHADALVTNRILKVGGENFGQSTFSIGYIVMSLTDGTNNPKDKRDRQDPDMYNLVRKIAKHEAGHLLGYNKHHDFCSVEGYDEPDDCLMYWRCSTDEICPKCKDALVGLWEGLEKKTGKKYFKD